MGSDIAIPFAHISICLAVPKSPSGLCFYSRLHFLPLGAYRRRIYDGSTVPSSIPPVIILRRCAFQHSLAPLSKLPGLARVGHGTGSIG